MMVTRNHTVCTISLSQTTYINTITILKHFHMTDSYGVSTPLYPNMVLSTTMSPTWEEAKQKMKGIPYLTGVGSLMYASMATHLDITFATNHLSQFNSNPSLPNWTTLQHVLQYLKWTRDFVLTLGGETSACLIGYTNSDYAGCMDI